jgi:putative tryptophan/tyrosine transport system substrate-binding protein
VKSRRRNSSVTERASARLRTTRGVIGTCNSVRVLSDVVVLKRLPRKGVPHECTAFDPRLCPPASTLPTLSARSTPCCRRLDSQSSISELGIQAGFDHILVAPLVASSAAIRLFPVAVETSFHRAPVGVAFHTIKPRRAAGRRPGASPRGAAMLSRRAFVTGAAAGLVAGPNMVLAQAQRSAPLRLALVSGANGVDEMVETGPPAFGLVLTELRRLGLVEGQSLNVERWSNAGRPESELPEFAKRVAASQPSIIYVNSSTATVAIKAATATIPVVFTAADPIGWGIVDNLPRPGGNVTGFATDAGASLYQKQLQLLVESARTKQVIYLLTSATIDSLLSRSVREGARVLGVELHLAVVEGAINEISVGQAIASASPKPGMALYVQNTAALHAFSAPIAAEALRLRLPAMGNRRSYADSGLLMSYGFLESETFRGAAGYIARIARGDSPAELPVQQPSRYEFVVNLKTARSMGIELPLSVLGFVNEYIE